MKVERLDSERLSFFVGIFSGVGALPAWAYALNDSVRTKSANGRKYLMVRNPDVEYTAAS